MNALGVQLGSTFFFFLANGLFLIAPHLKGDMDFAVGPANFADNGSPWAHRGAIGPNLFALSVLSDLPSLRSTAPQIRFRSRGTSQRIAFGNRARFFQDEGGPLDDDVELFLLDLVSFSRVRPLLP